jgi:hypothetical protein
MDNASERVDGVDWVLGDSIPQHRYPKAQAGRKWEPEGKK